MVGIGKQIEVTMFASAFAGLPENGMAKPGRARKDVGARHKTGQARAKQSRTMADPGQWGNA